LSQLHTIEFRNTCRTACALVVALACLAGPMAKRAAAEIISNGPVLAAGFASKNSVDMTIPSFGWRLELGACDTVDSWMQRIGTELTFPVEALFGVITGDEKEVEFQIVPMLRFEPIALQHSTVTPFLEGGIGLSYTGLHDLGLGSNILFSDDIGVGMSLPLPSGLPWTRWSVSYRFRHQSHAGLWAESNSGLNTQYVVLSLE